MGRRLAAAVLMIAFIAVSGVAAAAIPTYRSALRQATHNARLFSLETFDAKIIWHATFFSDAFRQAFIRRHIAVNHLDDAEAALFTADQEREQTIGWEFFITFYTKKEYKKFTMDYDSFWKIHLTTTSGDIVEPEAIDSIPITPYVQVMTPHVNRWSKAYRVTFPKVPLGDIFSLTIQSVVGESTLKWTTRPAQELKSIEPSSSHHSSHRRK